jgi:cbb3-type cytochrome oxidase subunit 3
MVKYLLQSYEGVQWFGIVALCIFFTVFFVAFLKAYFFSNKKEQDKMSRMPLDH